MNIDNKNPAQYASILNLPQQDYGLSVFNLQQNNDILIEQGKAIRKNCFSNFVSMRKEYLNGLDKLGDNWISGTSKQPTVDSIDISKSLLSELGSWYENVGYKNYVYPKIIMSPTPSGGIGMELEMFPNLSAYISIFNDKINFEVEKNGFFLEYQADKTDITKQLLNLYTTNEGGYYSER